MLSLMVQEAAAGGSNRFMADVVQSNDNSIEDGGGGEDKDEAEGGTDKGNGGNPLVGRPATGGVPTRSGFVGHRSKKNPISPWIIRSAYWEKSMLPPQNPLILVCERNILPLPLFPPSEIRLSLYSAVSGRRLSRPFSISIPPPNRFIICLLQHRRPLATGRALGWSEKERRNAQRKGRPRKEEEGGTFYS